jgi:hypothetical protein
MIPDVKPELEELIAAISTKNAYGGNKISPSIMALFSIVEDAFHCGIVVPYWLGVVERGRGKRRSNTDHGLVNKIYAWMQRRNMFTSKTKEGKFAEAKRLTWYINKYGNQQFRTKTYIDIYATERAKTIAKIDAKFASEINKVTISYDIL